MKAERSNWPLKLPFNLIENVTRDANSARLGYGFEPCCGVYTIAKQIVALEHNVAEVNPDAKS